MSYALRASRVVLRGWNATRVGKLSVKIGLYSPAPSNGISDMRRQPYRTVAPAQARHGTLLMTA